MQDLEEGLVKISYQLYPVKRPVKNKYQNKTSWDPDLWNMCNTEIFPSFQIRQSKVRKYFCSINKMKHPF